MIVSTVHAGMGFSHGILAIEVDGNGVHDLKIPGCRPCLSPDGTMITWSPGDKVVNVADIDFTGARPTLSHIRILDKREVAHTYHPDFSPDGAYITYSIGPGGRTAKSGPGTHTGVSELIGVRGEWDIYLRRANGQGPSICLTKNAALSNKESEWLPVRNQE